MKDIQDFIHRALPLSGLAGWGARDPQGAYVGECLADWLWPEQVEQLTRKVAAACAILPAHRLSTASTSWVYERARLYAGLRSDQDCLLLIIENRPGISLAKVNDLLRAFSNSTGS